MQCIDDPFFQDDNGINIKDQVQDDQINAVGAENMNSEDRFRRHEDKFGNREIQVDLLDFKTWPRCHYAPQEITDVQKFDNFPWNHKKADQMLGI